MRVQEPPLLDDPPRTRPRAGRVVIAGLAAAAIVAAGAAVWLTRGSGGPNPSHTALATADVVRTDLSDRTEVDGTLEYAGSYTVTGDGRGRVTWLPDVGDTIRRGGRVYGLDGHGVPLFYGSTPLWRPLRTGVPDGADVRELERNLAALGYGDGLTVDDHFTAATAAAVKDWQHDRDVTENGAVAPGDVVMQPGAIRVTHVTGTLGAPAAGRLLSATGTDRRITVKLPVNEEELAVEHAKVRVDLPGGKQTTGRVSSVGTVASASDDGSDGPPQTGQDTETATIPVHITLDHPSAAGRLDGAPVTVGFASGTHKNVLAVPVQALLAAANGGYSVNVVDASGTSRTVPVELGIFADGMVEVSGNGLAPGMKVEVPRS